jgi:hypothetical protein
VHKRPSAVLLSPDDLESLRRPSPSCLTPTQSDGVTEERYTLAISPTAHRQLTEHLPESVAFAVDHPVRAAAGAVPVIHLADAYR